MSITPNLTNPAFADATPLQVVSAVLAGNATAAAEAITRMMASSTPEHERQAYQAAFDAITIGDAPTPGVEIPDVPESVKAAGEVWTAHDELDRRARNRKIAKKNAKRAAKGKKPKAKVQPPATDEGRRLFGLRASQLRAEAGVPEPAKKARKAKARSAATEFSQRVEKLAEALEIDNPVGLKIQAHLYARNERWSKSDVEGLSDDDVLALALDIAGIED